MLCVGDVGVYACWIAFEFVEGERYDVYSYPGPRISDSITKPS